MEDVWGRRIVAHSLFQGPLVSVSSTLMSSSEIRGSWSSALLHVFLSIFNRAFHIAFLVGLLCFCVSFRSCTSVLASSSLTCWFNCTRSLICFIASSLSCTVFAFSSVSFSDASFSSSCIFLFSWFRFVQVLNNVSFHVFHFIWHFLCAFLSFSRRCSCAISLVFSV